jgi:hypothetical protein
MAAEMKFMNRMAGCLHLDHKKEFRHYEETDTQPVMLESYSCSWKNYVLQIPCSRIPFPIPYYQPEERS